MRKTFVVVDDHPSDLEIMRNGLQEKYSDAQILTLSVATGVEAMIEQAEPNVVIMDLSIPLDEQSSSEPSTGLALLDRLLDKYRQTNIVVRSAEPDNLIRLKRKIENHDAGFIILDKQVPKLAMLERIDWALKGAHDTREIRGGPEIREKWLKVLKLGLVEALKDEAIAQEMNVSLRTVRMYWSQAQDALGIYPDPRINQRIQTYNRARALGWID